MLRHQDVDYFLVREIEERARAASSRDPAVRDAHLQFAERYADAAFSAAEELEGAVRGNGLRQQSYGRSR